MRGGCSSPQESGIDVLPHRQFERRRKGTEGSAGNRSERHGCKESYRCSSESPHRKSQRLCNKQGLILRRYIRTSSPLRTSPSESVLPWQRATVSSEIGSELGQRLRGDFD